MKLHKIALGKQTRTCSKCGSTALKYDANGATCTACGKVQ